MRKYVLLLCLILGLASTSHGNEIVTNAQELLMLDKMPQQDIRFAITGQILIPPYWTNLPFFVEINGLCTKVYSRFETAKYRCKAGDLVLLNGETNPSLHDGLPNLDGISLNCTSLKRLAKGTLPEAAVLNISDYLKGNYVNKRISIRGTLTDILPDDIDTRFFHLTLTDQRQTAYLLWQGPPNDLTALRMQQGAEVIATGIGFPSFGSRAFAPSLPLLISGKDALHVVRQSNLDLPDVPEITSYDENWQMASKLGKLHKLRGVVTARWNGDSFLLHLSDGKSVRVELSDSVLPRLGEVVEAVGHLETDLIDLYLLRAFWRKTEGVCAPAQSPIAATLQELFTNNSGSGMTQPDSQGKTYQVQGIIKNISFDVKGFKSFLLAENNHSILVNCSCVSNALDAVSEGCVVRVTGVCVKESDIWRPNVDLPKIRGIFFVLNKPEDLQILTTPPWWTPSRFALAFALLLSALVAVLIWNATLRSMVTRKSRALLREQAAKLEETLKIDERTRLAAELHDYLAQNLTVISYQVSAAESALAANSADTAECLKTADRMLLSCRADLRRCLWDLKSDALNEPEFAKAIERTSEPVSGDARLLVRFAVSRNRLNDSTAHAILSICRELVANAVRHGKADKVQIAGELKDGALRFSVRDNGIGFDPTTRPGQTDGHFGLDGVAERIRRLNGQLQIDSTPGKGTRIVVTLRPKDSPT